VSLRPELARLQHLEQALDIEMQAWGSSFWRGWSAGAGYSFSRVGPSDGHGFLVTLEVPLALWNTHAAQTDRLVARQTEIHSELVFRAGVAQREVQAARARLDAVLQALEAMPEPSQDSVLTVLASVAFDAGEATLIDLLDALASEIELQLVRLELQANARRAAIALDRCRGLGVTP
jgi:outer membrane protein TolC